MSAPLPECEPARLLALHLLNVLDSAPEPAYNDIVALSAQSCGAPIALVSLVDSDRQWFKARHGLEACETPRSQSFCAYAILQEDVFVVPDTHKDARFADNPLVLGEPYIRFYAGMPLITDEGLALGSLCVIDTVPRVLMAQELETLQLLAKHVVMLLALRRAPEASEQFAEESTQLQVALQASYEQVETLWLQQAFNQQPAA